MTRTEMDQLNVGDKVEVRTYNTTTEEYELISFSFDHNPTDYEIKIAATIAEFSLHPYEVVYCAEQSKEINWLDISGDIFDKYITSKNYYEKSLEQ